MANSATDVTLREHVRKRRTYGILSLVAILALVFVAPSLMAGAGLIDVENIEGFGMLSGILLGIPFLVVIIVAVGFTLWGLVRGPVQLRWQLIWWLVILIVSGAPTRLTEGDPGRNPYLRTNSGLGVSDAILFIGLVLCVALPVLWWVKDRKTETAVHRESVR